MSQGLLWRRGNWRKRSRFLGRLHGGITVRLHEKRETASKSSSFVKFLMGGRQTSYFHFAITPRLAPQRSSLFSPVSSHLLWAVGLSFLRDDMRKTKINKQKYRKMLFLPLRKQPFPTKQKNRSPFYGLQPYHDFAAFISSTAAIPTRDEQCRHAHRP